MKTKNKRLLIIFSTFCLVLFLGLFSSQLFKLKSVEINFYDENNLKVTNINSNNVFNTQKKVDDILSSVNFDYGNLVFLINKNSYLSILEQKNPYLKLQNIQIKFPNKLIVNATERKPYFFIVSANNYYFLDNTFKLLEILSEQELNNTQNLISLETTSKNTKTDFFSFFSVLPSVYEAGQNLSENNAILNCLLSLPEGLNNFNKNYNQTSTNIFNKVVLQEQTSNVVNLQILTSTNSYYGITLIIEDIFSNFNKKLNKSLNALSSLKKTEPIKCSFGQLKIDNNYNCFWNNL